MGAFSQFISNVITAILGFKFAILLLAFYLFHLFYVPLCLLFFWGLFLFFHFLPSNSLRDIYYFISPLMLYNKCPHKWSIKILFLCLQNEIINEVHFLTGRQGFDSELPKEQDITPDTTTSTYLQR